MNESQRIELFLKHKGLKKFFSEKSWLQKWHCLLSYK